MKILTLVGDIYEDLELWYPKLRLIEAGAQVVVAGEQAGVKYAGKHSYPCTSDAAYAEQRAADFDGLVVPGGFMPDKLRRDPALLQLVRDFHQQGKLIAAICHGPWVLISAGITRGRKMTAYWSIEADLRNSGADYQHKVPVVVDGNFITSPHYANNSDFMKAVVAHVERLQAG